MKIIGARHGLHCSQNDTASRQTTIAPAVPQRVSRKQDRVASRKAAREHGYARQSTGRILRPQKTPAAASVPRVPSPVYDVELEDEEQGGLNHARWEEHVLDNEGNPMAKQEKVDRALESLARPEKVRKSKAGDFELVPSIRAVVVLDDKFTADAPMATDLQHADDQWECLDDDEFEIVDSEKGPIKSYADVV